MHASATYLDSTNLGIIRAAISIMTRPLNPYRDEAVVDRKLFGIIHVRFTSGELLDWLNSAFGEAVPAEMPAR